MFHVKRFGKVGPQNLTSRKTEARSRTCKIERFFGAIRGEAAVRMTIKTVAGRHIQCKFREGNDRVSSASQFCPAVK
jgi:hypothetical protein